MTGARNAKGSSGRSKGEKKERDSKSTAGMPSQIEYLLYQSTQGVHFMFDNRDIAKVMKSPMAKQDFHTTENMEKVQELLSGFLNRPTFSEKKTYLESLPEKDFDLLVRAYFQLVENTILAHSTLRH